MPDLTGPDALENAYAHCAQLLKARDPDRHLALLFAPGPMRKFLIAPYAFNSEIASIRDLVSEALPGEMRLQWWRDRFESGHSGTISEHPVAQALFDTIERYRLPETAFHALIDARQFDLYENPMPDWNALEGYCGETSSALFRLSTLVLADGKEPGGAALCGHAGVAFALTGLLRAFPFHARRRQCFLPESLLTACGVKVEDIFAGDDSEALRAALAQMRERARVHLAMVDAGFAGLDARIRPAFLPLALCQPYLARMENRAYRPFATLVDRAPLGKFWTLASAALSGRI